jgi:hypothetical protein
MFIEGERKRKGIGYRIVKIYRYEETLERINLGYNLRIHYRLYLRVSCGPYSRWRCKFLHIAAWEVGFHEQINRF